MRPRRRRRNSRVATWTRCNSRAATGSSTAGPRMRRKISPCPWMPSQSSTARRRKLLDGVPLVDAARFYARHHRRGVKRKAVPDAVDEMIEVKRLGGVSDVYLADLRYRLGMFADSFQCDLVSLSPDDMQSFFERIQLAPCSFNNFLRTLRTFCRFAQDHGWLSKESIYSSACEEAQGNGAPVEIFTPQEMAALLEHATPQIAPCFALAAFAGLRSEEILRLEWARRERQAGLRRSGRAQGENSGTRRIVPITDNLARWLVAPRER